jgi:RND family efflux transporter MFP subunit
LREAQQATEEVERSIDAARSSKNSAEAQRRLAAKTFERYSVLLERRSVSPQEFEEVQARRRVAEAEAERAERMLDALTARKNQILARVDQARADAAAAELNAGYAKISSPINGVVTARQVEVGQRATPGAPLLTIEDDSRYRLEAPVEESRALSLQKGSPVTISFDALGGREFESKIVEIVPASDPASRSVMVKVEVPREAAGMGLRSGMFGKARFVVGQKQALTVPQSAVVQRGQITGVYVVDSSGVARFRIISAGARRGDRVEILSGLSEGERIVIAGVETVSDGERVD